MSGDPGRRRTASLWLAVALLFVGLLGATVAVSGLWAPLPEPSPGSTCGPGLGSEAAIAALVRPGSIGAGAEPPASRPAARANWHQFVHACQTAADRRALLTVPMLALSLILGVIGMVLVWRRFAADSAAPPVGDRPPHPGDDGDHRGAPRPTPLPAPPVAATTYAGPAPPPGPPGVPGPH